jgi:hypothetical protein
LATRAPSHSARRPGAMTRDRAPTARDQSTPSPLRFPEYRARESRGVVTPHPWRPPFNVGHAQPSPQRFDLANSLAHEFTPRPAGPSIPARVRRVRVSRPRRSIWPLPPLSVRQLAHTLAPSGKLAAPFARSQFAQRRFPLRQFRGHRARTLTLNRVESFAASASRSGARLGGVARAGRAGPRPGERKPGRHGAR